MKKKILFLLFFLGITLTFCKVNIFAEDYYKLGEHLEAENFNVNKLTVIGNNPNASGYKALDAGASGTVEYEINMANAGKYRLALGYYSGGNNDQAAVKVKVNDSAEKIYKLTTFNGWCQDTNRLPIAMDIEVELNQGKNKIIYGAAGSYVNLDYIAIYELDAPYESEEMHAHLQADGSRIQAEWSVDVVGGYCDKNIRIADKGNCSDGFTLSVDDDRASKPGYKIHAKEAGTYIFQVAFYGDQNITPTYLFNINGTNKNITLPKSPAHWERNNYSTKASFEVDLKEGENIIYFSYIGSGYADFDWFRVYKKETLKLNDVIEAEDYILGDVNAQKSNSKYSHVSNYAVELAQGKIEFEVEVAETKDYVLYVNSYTNTANAFQHIEINGVKSQLVYQNPNGWIDEVSNATLTEFKINLTEGKNKVVITKGEDSLAYNYIDLDFFVITEEKVITDKILLDINETPKIETSSFIKLNDYEIKVLDEEVVNIVDGKVVVVGGGKTNIEVIYYVNGVKVVKVIPVEVAKMEYKGTDISVKDTTKTYTGNKCLVDIEMPEGWSFVQSGDANEVGEYEVTVTFSHPNYNSITKKAKLIITKAVYEGTDLFVKDSEFKYDGEEKYVIASAPQGWNISYENNGQIEKGEYEVTVTFSHKNYEDVVKTVKLSIVNGSGCGGSITTSILSVLILTAAVFLFRKKKNTCK